MRTITEICAEARQTAAQALQRGEDELGITQAMVDAAAQKGEVTGADMLGIFLAHAASLVATRRQTTPA